MVENNRQVLLKGAANRQSVSAPPPAPDEKKKNGSGRVVAVQCIACAVILLLALLLRTLGGGVYEQLRRGFNDSLMSNGLLSTLAALWDGPPPESGVSEDALLSEPSVPDTADSEPAAPESTPSTPSDTTEPVTGTAAGRLPPEGAVAVRLRVNRVAYPPLSAGTLTSGYGYRDNPTGSGEQFHRGVDIAAPAGTPIAAMFYAEVKEVGENDARGRYIVLSHGDGVEVLYAHCSAVLAEQGAHIRAGETVALVGTTGDSTGNHVHICVSRDGTVFNPTAVVPVERYA